MRTSTHWFYYKDGRGFGPIAEAEVFGLLKSGAITADTLVWREGLDNWTAAQATVLFLSKIEDIPASPTNADTTQPPAISTATEDATFEKLLSGIPDIAKTILNLDSAKRQIALQAVERRYHKLAASWGYPEMRAKQWASLVMDVLRREIEDQTTAHQPRGSDRG